MTKRRSNNWRIVDRYDWNSPTGEIGRTVRVPLRTKIQSARATLLPIPSNISAYLCIENGS